MTSVIPMRRPQGWQRNHIQGQTAEIHQDKGGDNGYGDGGADNQVLRIFRRNIEELQQPGCRSRRYRYIINRGGYNQPVKIDPHINWGNSFYVLSVLLLHRNLDRIGVGLLHDTDGNTGLTIHGDDLVSLLKSVSLQPDQPGAAPPRAGLSGILDLLQAANSPITRTVCSFKPSSTEPADITVLHAQKTNQAV